MSAGAMLRTGESQPVVSNSRDDALVALLDSIVGKADQKELHAARDVHLDGDDSGIDALQRCSKNLDKHLFVDLDFYD